MYSNEPYGVMEMKLHDRLMLNKYVHAEYNYFLLPFLVVIFACLFY